MKTMKTKQPCSRGRMVLLILGSIVTACLLSQDVSAQQKQKQPQTQTPAQTASPAVGTDKAEPELIRTLKIPSSASASTTSFISPDGSKYAFPEAGGLTVFDMETGKELYSKKSKTKFCHPVAFSPDGKQIAFGHLGSHTITVCGAETGKKLFEFIVPEGKKQRVNRDVSRTHPSRNEYGQFIDNGVLTLEFSADGKRLAMAVNNDLSSQTNNKNDSWSQSNADTIIVYDLESRSAILICDLALLGVEALSQYSGTQSLAFSPDGKFVAFPCHNITDAVDPISGMKTAELMIMDVETGKPFHRLQNKATMYIMNMVFSPDGKRLFYSAGTYQGYSTCVFNMKTKIETTLESQLMYPVFSFDGKYVFHYGDTAKPGLTGIEIATGKQVYQKKNFVAVPLSAKSRIYLGAVGGNVNRAVEEGLGIYEFTSVDDLVAQLQHAEPVVPTPTVNTETAQSLKWKQIHNIQTQGSQNYVTSLAISPDGKFLDFTSSKDEYGGEIFHTILDIETGKKVAKFQSNSDTSASRFSQDSKEYYYFSGDYGNIKLSVVDTSTWKIKRSLDSKYIGYLNIEYFSSDGRFLIGRADADDKGVIDIKTGKSYPLPLPTHFLFNSPQGVGARIDFMPSEKTVVVQKENPNAHYLAGVGLIFYDIVSRKKVKEIDKLPIDSFCILPDGKRILAQYAEQKASRLVIIDLEQGEVLSRIGEGYAVGYGGYKVSSDGKYFVIANYTDRSGGLTILDATTLQPIDTIPINDKHVAPQFVMSHDCKTIGVVVMELYPKNNEDDKRDTRILLFRAK